MNFLVDYAGLNFFRYFYIEIRRFRKVAAQILALLNDIIYLIIFVPQNFKKFAKLRKFYVNGLIAFNILEKLKIFGFALFV